MQIRAATLDDVARLAAFMGRCTLAHQGVRRASEDEMRQRLTRPGSDPALDTWLAEDDDVVGFAQVWPEPNDVVCYIRVDPAHTGKGIATALLERAGPRARRLADAPLHATSSAKDDAAGPFLEAHGFVPIRYVSLMTIELDRQPEPAAWPENVHVTALGAETDLQPVFDAVSKTFPERTGGFEEWLHEYEGLDPTLWFIAEDDSGIAGFALCMPELAEDAEAGYIAELGVREDRRGEGLGLALLRHAFIALHARGRKRASLHVDADNLTGAVRLYTRAGMTPDPRFVVWEQRRNARGRP